MIRSKVSVLAVIMVTAAAPAVMAQQGGWIANQVNATMCFWEQVRAALVRDTVYMDGGYLWWIPGLANGEYGAISRDENPTGVVYTLNFSTPFNVSQNMTAIFGTINKGSDGGPANNLAPNYEDGAMLADNNRWFLYGGLLRGSDLYAPPDQDDIISYRAHRYPGHTGEFQPGFFNSKLPSGLTRYVAYGGAANAPSENKAWYFSGLRSPSWGPIFRPTLNDSRTAVNVSNTLITLDMSLSRQEKWSNKTLPDNIKGRANPELVWVPYGAQGLLLAIGGVTYPEFARSARKSANAAASDSESREFMSTIDVYDIANDKWYRQPTSGGGLGPLTRGCAVAVPAKDYSSVSVYYYGGYDGISLIKDFNDDVWVLSLPSFMWTKVTSGRPSYGRAGHKCVTPYPDQMVVIGGYTTFTGKSHRCVKGSIVQVLNLTSGKWMDGYDPSKYYDYGIPETIYLTIGGGAHGGATMKMPKSTGWATPALSSIFATTYPASKMTSYYPYASVAPSNNTNPDVNGGGGGGGGGGGVPSYLPPLLGAIGGAIVLTGIIAGIIIYRRRNLLKRNGYGPTSDSGTDENGNRILSWIRGQPSENKTLTASAIEDTPCSPDMETGTPVPLRVVQHAPPVGHGPGMVPQEMADTSVIELPADTSHPVPELLDTGLSPLEIINRHTHLGQQNGGSVHTSNNYSSISQTDHASTVSRSSAPQGVAGSVNAAAATAGAVSPDLGDSTSPGRPDSSTPGFNTAPDLPPLMYNQHRQQQPNLSQSRFFSGVSGISERDRGHLRQVSDETVSSYNNSVHYGSVQPTQQFQDNNRGDAAGLQQQQQHQQTQQNTNVLSPISNDGTLGGLMIGTLPVSPPLPGVTGEAGSSRRSVFRENDDDLGGPR